MKHYFWLVGLVVGSVGGGCGKGAEGPQAGAGEPVAGVGGDADRGASGGQVGHEIADRAELEELLGRPVDVASEAFVEVAVTVQPERGAVRVRVEEAWGAGEALWLEEPEAARAGGLVLTGAGRGAGVRSLCPEQSQRFCWGNPSDGAALVGLEWEGRVPERAVDEERGRGWAALVPEVGVLRPDEVWGEQDGAWLLAGIWPRLVGRRGVMRVRIRWEAERAPRDVAASWKGSERGVLGNGGKTWTFVGESERDLVVSLWPDRRPGVGAEAARLIEQAVEETGARGQETVVAVNAVLDGLGVVAVPGLVVVGEDVGGANVNAGMNVNVNGGAGANVNGGVDGGAGVNGGANGGANVNGGAGMNGGADVNGGADGGATIPGVVAELVSGALAQHPAPGEALRFAVARAVAASSWRRRGADGAAECIISVGFPVVEAVRAVAARGGDKAARRAVALGLALPWQLGREAGSVDPVLRAATWPPDAMTAAKAGLFAEALARSIGEGAWQALGERVRGQRTVGLEAFREAVVAVAPRPEEARALLARWLDGAHGDEDIGPLRPGVVLEYLVGDGLLGGLSSELMKRLKPEMLHGVTQGNVNTPGLILGLADELLGAEADPTTRRWLTLGQELFGDAAAQERGLGALVEELSGELKLGPEAQARLKLLGGEALRALRAGLREVPAEEGEQAEP